MPASTSTLSGVAIATWAASTPSTAATSRLTWRSATESAYAPERSSTWPTSCGAVMRRCLRGARVESGVTRAPTTVRRRRCAPIAEQGGGQRRPRPACRGRRRQAANSGSTSPGRAQSSSVAERTVVRSRAARDGAPTSVGRVAGRDEHGQPAAQDVVAERRESAAVADEAVQRLVVDARGAGRGRRALLRPVGGPRLRDPRARRPKDVCRGRSGDATSTNRPTRRGSPARTGSRARHRGCRRRRREPARPTRPRPERAAAGAQGTWAAAGATTPTQRPATSTYTAAGDRCSTRTGPSAAERGARRREAVRLPTTHQGPRFPTLSAAVTVDRCEVVPTIPEWAQVLTCRSPAVTIRDDATLRSPGWTRCTPR